MSVRQLKWHAVEKVWGRRDFPSVFGDPAEFDEPLGEVWFQDDPSADLLVKHLFTSEKLSIQVHPSDDRARQSGYPRGKDEAWFVLSAEPGATIGAGFDSELTADELRAASLDGSIEQLLTWHEVKPGDFFYVPAGTVHAIGAGLSVLEIQQNVDLTYRLFDYGRPRELQLDEGVAASSARPFLHRASEVVGNGREVLVAGPKFVIERLGGPETHEVVAGPTSPAWLMPITDGCTVNGAEMLNGTVWLAEEWAKIGLGPDDTLLVAYAGSTLH